MQQRMLGAILLVAGTAIGSGMLSLPIVLCKIGIIPSFLLILFISLVTYLSSIINLEIFLSSEENLDLGGACKKYSGNTAYLIGKSLFKILSYSLVSVYLYGGASILKNFLASNYMLSIDQFDSILIYSLFIIFILLLPITLVDYCNRFLFITLLIITFGLVFALSFSEGVNNIAFFSSSYDNISFWTIAIPIVFTSFGFQGSIPAIINYCNRDHIMLKKVFFWGTLIPAITYIIWTFSVIIALYRNNLTFYYSMINGNVEVGDMIEELGQIAQIHYIQNLVWAISMLAIMTSVIGVSISLMNSINLFIKQNLTVNKLGIKILSTLAIILPGYFFANWVPNAFISILGFAGIILVTIALIMPLYLLDIAKSTKDYFYAELKNRFLIKFIMFSAIGICLSEFYNFIN